MACYKLVSVTGGGGLRWTEEHDELLIRAVNEVKDRHGAHEQLKTLLKGVTFDAFDHRLKRLRRTQPDRFQRGIDLGMVGTPPTVTVFDEAWELTGPAVIVGDVHCPLTDWDLLEEVCKTAKRFKIDKLIIAGDMFDGDAFSTHDAIVPRVSFDTECDAAEYAIDRMLRVFTKIYAFLGNHDERFLKRLGGALGTGRAAETFLSWIRGDREGRVEWSTYAYCTLKTPAGPYLVCHPNQYRQVRGSTAAEIALIEQKHCITHHEHHLAKTVDKSGRYVAIANGTLADPDKMAYVARYKNTRPRMVKGYTVIDKGGVAHVFGGPIGFSTPGTLMA